MPDHTCEDCGKVFEAKGALDNHKVVHSTDRPFVCEICGNAFKLKGALTRHLRVHKDVAAFACDQCDRRFREKSDLKRHKLIHSGIKSHKCDQCGRAFTLWSNLNRHMLVHSDGPKPFSCSVCNKQFTRSTVTLKHVRKAHPDITDAASHVRKTITQTATQTTRETLDDGRVATCTTQTTQISRYLSTSVSYIETQTASVRAISQEHPMVTVSTFTQQSPRVSASAGTEEGTPEVLVDVDHIHRVLDDPGDQDFWKELLDE